MLLTTTGLYAALLGIMLIALRTMVTIKRAKTGISIYHSDNISLAESIRKHGNFVENVPYAIILMAVSEIGGTLPMWLHITGAVLIVGRILHPIGLKADQAKNPLRIIGGIATQASMIISIIFILGRSF